MDFEVRRQEDVDRLEANAIRERLAYVAAALRLLRAELGRAPLCWDSPGRPGRSPIS
jgi:hypothetical protein